MNHFLMSLLASGPRGECSGLTVCGTGHRPQHLPGGFSEEAFERLVMLAYRWLAAHHPKAVVVGMALGWDQALAVAAIRLGIPVDAYIPFSGQANAWPLKSHEKYQWILNQCRSSRIICFGEYRPSMMQDRNKEMVKASDQVLALWNGDDGGTANCVRYAEKVGKPVINLWPELEHLASIE